MTMTHLTGFAETCWTQIEQLHDLPEAEQQELYNWLIARYWKPVFSFLVRTGHRREAAQDLTQGFFIDIVLEKGLFLKADRNLGRFRTLLLTALKRYAVSVYRHDNAKQRRPPGGWMSLDALADAGQSPGIVETTGADREFHAEWARGLIERVLAAVQTQYEQEGETIWWEVFRRRVVDPNLYGAETPSMESLCKAYQLPDRKLASNRLLTAKRRFMSQLRQEVGQEVKSEDEIEDELTFLLEVLGG